MTMQEFRHQLHDLIDRATVLLPPSEVADELEKAVEGVRRGDWDWK